MRLRPFVQQGLDIVAEWGPWSCWRQGHGWIRCLRNPVHRYEVK